MNGIDQRSDVQRSTGLPRHLWTPGQNGSVSFAGHGRHIPAADESRVVRSDSSAVPFLQDVK